MLSRKPSPTPGLLAATANRYVHLSSHTPTQNELFEVVKKSVADGTGEGTCVNSEEVHSPHSTFLVHMTSPGR